MNVYEQIGPEKIRSIIEEFYIRAFQDLIIGHLFFHSDHDRLVELQWEFTSALLGGPATYQGEPIRRVHQRFDIWPAHFDRRQVILRQVMVEFGLSIDQIREWLTLEQRFRPQIIKTRKPG